MKYFQILSYKKTMKLRFFTAIFLMASCSFHSGYAQTDANEEKIKEMDLSVFENKIFLNKAIVIDEMMELFREIRKDK